MNKVILIAFLIGFASTGAYASCANSCSGHGSCGANDKCSCYANFMGVDCSLRKCPFGTAFADKNNAGGVHAYSECSNNGVCDREAGECVCGEGFTGAACDRNVCPNDCSGHGRCTFVEDMASGSYNQWDKNQARGCLCDPYFTGPDCSLRKCPVGDDVLTTEVECGGVSNGMQVDEVQKVTVWADRMLGGEMTLTFTDMYGQAWTTRPIAVGGENIYELYAGDSESSSSAAKCLTYTTPGMYVTDWYKGAVPASDFQTKSEWMFDGDQNPDDAADWILPGSTNDDGTRAYACHAVNDDKTDDIASVHNAMATSPSDTPTANANYRATIEIDDFKNDYRMTMGEIGTIASATGSIVSQGDHSNDIKNALEELPYNVIPSVTVSKDAVNVAGTGVGGNKFKQQYSITFDNAANSGDQNMLTCNAEACDEDGCAPRTSGVTHNKFFSKEHDLGTNGVITTVGQGSFKIKVSNAGGYMWRGGVATNVASTSATTLTFNTAAGVISNNDYIKIANEWMQVDSVCDTVANSDCTDLDGTPTTVTRAKFSTSTTGTDADTSGDVWVQKTVPTSFGTWTVCRPFADGSKSCASFPGSSSAATVQTALRTITGWEGVTVTLEKELLWVDQTYVVTYAAGYDDEGVEPTIDAYLIATDNTGVGLNAIGVDEHGVATATLGSVPVGMDHTDADTLTGHVYVGGSPCPYLFNDGGTSDGHVGMGVLELYPRALYSSPPDNDKFKFKTAAKPTSSQSCASTNVYPIAPYISDVEFSNSIYMATDSNTITKETTAFYNKHTHNAGIFPSTKFAVGDSLTVLSQTGDSNIHKVFKVKSFKRNRAGVEFTKVWPAPTASVDILKLRVSGNNGLSFSRSHESINVYRNEIVKIALSHSGGAYKDTVTHGTWRITVNGVTSEILSYSATTTEIAGAISKLSTVTGLVTVTKDDDASALATGDREFTVTFTRSEGDVMHVTALSVVGDELRNGNGAALGGSVVEASIGIGKEQDGYAFYDPLTKGEKADMLADDVAVGTIINVTASEVVDFFINDPDTDGCIPTPGALTIAASALSAKASTDGSLIDNLGQAANGAADTYYSVGSEVMFSEDADAVLTRAFRGTKAQSHAASTPAYPLGSCINSGTKVLESDAITNCKDESCPALIFNYNGIVSVKCQVIANDRSGGAVAAHGVTTVAAGSTEPGCQEVLQKIPGLGSATVSITLPSSSDTLAAGAGGVDLVRVSVTLPKGVDGSGLSATLLGSILPGAPANALAGNEFLYRRHWRNNNGRSFVVTRARENRVGAITAVTDSGSVTNSFNVDHKADVHGMSVEDGEFVAVHNIPNGRTSSDNSKTFDTSVTDAAGTDMAHAQRGQVYRLGTGCYLQLIETGSQGNTIQARFHYVSGTCDATAALRVAHQGDTDVIVSDGQNVLASRITGASDIIMPSAGASSSVDSGVFASADNVPQISDALASVAGDLSYANAYYGVGGDMLVVDSQPDAIHGSDPIAMDITYTGPSGSCSVEEVTKGSKESAVCSNRGVCDYETGTCVCAEGFMKEACSEQSVLV